MMYHRVGEKDRPIDEVQAQGKHSHGNHSIESALIQASSKGYTIDMILGSHDRQQPQNRPSQNAVQSSSSSHEEPSDDGTTYIPF